MGHTSHVAAATHLLCTLHPSFLIGEVLDTQEALRFTSELFEFWLMKLLKAAVDQKLT